MCTFFNRRTSAIYVNRHCGCCRCAQCWPVCPAVACGAVLVVCGGSWWRCAVLCCAVLLALSQGIRNSAKIDFEADSRRLLSQGYTRVAQCIKNLLNRRSQDVSTHFANTAKKTPVVCWCVFSSSR